MAQFHLKFLLITQHEVPFKNTSEATKKVERPNGEPRPSYDVSEEKRMANNSGVKLHEATYR